jgi:hypothetical protein
MIVDPLKDGVRLIIVLEAGDGRIFVQEVLIQGDP